MQLNLCVDGQLLATVPVDPENWKDQKYLNVLAHIDSDNIDFTVHFCLCFFACFLLV